MQLFINAQRQLWFIVTTHLVDKLLTLFALCSESGVVLSREGSLIIFSTVQSTVIPQLTTLAMAYNKT